MTAPADIDQRHVEGMFTGQLLRELGPDLLRSTLLEFRHGYEMEKLASRDRQKLIASEEQTASHRMIDGLGQLKLRVDMTSYLYWEMRKPGCWADAQFRRDFHRDNPECRVNTTTKATVIVPATKYTKLPKNRRVDKPGPSHLAHTQVTAGSNPAPATAHRGARAA